MTVETNSNNAPSRRMVPVAPEFWVELHHFLEEHEVTAMDLKRAGINYNTASKIAKGLQTASSVNSDYMMIFMDVVNDPEKYKRRVVEGAITSLSEMMNLNLTSS